MPAAATTLPSKRTNEPSAVEMLGLHSRQDGAPAAAPTVLIVGTGPAGLFAACELLRHGVRPRVVERRLEPHHQARGTALQPAVLEMLDRAGLIDPFLHASVRIRHLHVLGPGLQELANQPGRHWRHLPVPVQPAAMAYRNHPA